VKLRLTAGVVVADEFAVGAATVIEPVELVDCQTGASSAVPTATGVFLEILNAAPSASGAPVAGSPGFANNLFASNLVSHAFSGVFQVQDTAQAATSRPILSVKVVLPTPVTLTAGVYWLQWSLTGSLASGPWCPPLATLDQGATGNAEQKVGATAAACGFTGIPVEGAPNVGGYLRTNLSNVRGAGVGDQLRRSTRMSSARNFGVTSTGWRSGVASSSRMRSRPAKT